MTLIIGARCKDGVVLVADSKAIRGDEERYEQKMIGFFENNVILATAGSANLLDKFIRQIDLDIENTRNQLPENKRAEPVFKNKEDFLLYLERKIRFFRNEYSQDGVSLDLLAGFTGTKSSLHVLGTGSPSESEIHDYLAIGHGAPYSKLVMKTLWKPEMDIIQCGSLVLTVLHMITNLSLDLTVGGQPNIVLIPDNQIARGLSPEESEEIEGNVKKIVNYFNTFLKSSFKIFFPTEK